MKLLKFSLLAPLFGMSIGMSTGKRLWTKLLKTIQIIVMPAQINRG